MGYRRLTYHLRSHSQIWAARDEVYDSLKEVDAEGLEERRAGRLKRRIFHADGPNQVWSLDGHDKLKRWGFAIHGCIDVYSRYIVWMRVGRSNNDARYVLSYYLDSLRQTTVDENGEERHGTRSCCLAYSYSFTVVVIPEKIRSDRGTETTDLYGYHLALHALSGNLRPEDSWVYGRSVHNQKIESLWSQMIKQWESEWQKTFKEIEWADEWALDNERQKRALIFVYMPIIRQEIAQWHRDHNVFPTRFNRLSRLPNGPPQDNFMLSDQDFGVSVDSRHLEEIREGFLADFDADTYMSVEEQDHFNNLMLESPLGPQINLHNARQQYRYLIGVR